MVLFISLIFSFSVSNNETKYRYANKNSTSKEIRIEKSTNAYITTKNDYIHEFN